MSAPQEIVDSLECIIDIFLSGVRHRERAAFILCDNLVELACKTKAKQYNHRFDSTCNFYQAWNAQGVALPPDSLGRRVQDYREVRNNMQHGSAAATVDVRYCATAIITAVEVIDHLWVNTSTQHIYYWMQVALKVIRLYSNFYEDTLVRTPFQDLMRDSKWRSPEQTYVRVNSIPIELGQRSYWHMAIRINPQLVEECLRKVEADI